jgi:CCR4-NOT transcription complex subunit 4
MTVNQQSDAMICASVAGLLPFENKNTVHSDQYGFGKHLDWSSELQSCVPPLVNSSPNTDKQPMKLLDGTDVPSYSSFIRLPDTSDTSFWDNAESNHILTALSNTSMIQTKQSTTDNTYGFLNGVQDELGTVYPYANGCPEMESRQPGAISVRTDNIGNFDKTISVNRDENRIISDILLSEFNLWDASYSTTNDYVKLLRDSESIDGPLVMPPWKSGTSSNESRFAFARPDNQGSATDSSLRKCGSEKNFSLLSQNYYGNVYQNDLGHQSLENSLAMSDMSATGTPRSKIPVPPGFSAPARVPPPGFPSQDGLNPPPGFSSGIPSRDGSNPSSRYPSSFSSGISLQNGSNPPSRFPSTFSSGFPSQGGLGSPSRFSSAFLSGFPSQDGSNSCSRFHPLVSSGFPSQDGSNPPSRFPSAFSSQDGSNQVYGSAYSETRIRDSLLGGNTNHYEPQLARHTSDIEFVDPAILAMGKGRMPGISDSELEMKNTSAFPAQLQMINNDQRIQLLMQQNMQPHQRTHIQDAFNTMNDNYLASRILGQNRGSLSSYTQMSPQQPRSSYLTNGHLHGWSDLRQGNNIPMSDMSGILYPSEANNLHMMDSNDLYNRAYGM